MIPLAYRLDAERQQFVCNLVAGMRGVVARARRARAS